MIKFSVVCPVHNSEIFILITIMNILNQSEPPDELIIVDDGSTDGTRIVLDKFVSSYAGPVTFKLIYSMHKGPGAARNIGIQNCRNQWIAFIDSDDSWELQKLQRIAFYIESNPNCNVFCNGERFVKLDQSIKELNYSLYYKPEISLINQLYKRNLFSPSATVCNINLFQRKGYFDEELSSSQDYELWLKLASVMRPFFIPEILGFYYQRDGNISSKKRFKRLNNLLKVLFRYRKKVPFLIFSVSVAKTFFVFVLSIFKK